MGAGTMVVLRHDGATTKGSGRTMPPRSARRVGRLDSCEGSGGTGGRDNGSQCDPATERRIRMMHSFMCDRLLVRKTNTAMRPPQRCPQEATTDHTTS